MEEVGNLNIFIVVFLWSISYQQQKHFKINNSFTKLGLSMHNSPKLDFKSPSELYT